MRYQSGYIQLRYILKDITLTKSQTLDTISIKVKGENSVCIVHIFTDSNRSIEILNYKVNPRRSFS